MAHNTKTPVHVLLVPETAVVLQPPHLVPSRVLLVSHPDVVLVWLHGQDPPALQHGLDILPGPWGQHRLDKASLSLYLLGSAVVGASVDVQNPMNVQTP